MKPSNHSAITDFHQRLAEYNRRMVAPMKAQYTRETKALSRGFNCGARVELVIPRANGELTFKSQSLGQLIETYIQYCEGAS